MSPWIQHVKFFAKAKGMKYNEACLPPAGVLHSQNKVINAPPKA
jgi:hypothetical protein